MFHMKRINCFVLASLLIGIVILSTPTSFGRRTKPSVQGLEDCRICVKGTCETGICGDRCVNPLGNGYPSQCPNIARPTCCAKPSNDNKCTVGFKQGNCCDRAVGQPVVYPNQCSAHAPQCCIS